MFYFVRNDSDVRLQRSDKMAASLVSSGTRRSRAVGACPTQAKECDGPMTATLTAPVEALFREQVAKGHFPSLDRALEVAVKTVDGRRASHTRSNRGWTRRFRIPANASRSHNCTRKRHEGVVSRETPATSMPKALAKLRWRRV